MKKNFKIRFVVKKLVGVWPAACCEEKGDLKTI